MGTHMSMCSGALHERALTHRLRGVESAKDNFVAPTTSVGNFVETTFGTVFWQTGCRP